MVKCALERAIPVGLNCFDTIADGSKIVDHRVDEELESNPHFSAITGHQANPAARPPRPLAPPMAIQDGSTPDSSLVKQPESKSGTIHQPHRTVQCRVFKDAGAVAT